MAWSFEGAWLERRDGPLPIFAAVQNKRMNVHSQSYALAAAITNSYSAEK
jgi:hypothetical protein